MLDRFIYIGFTRDGQERLLFLNIDMSEYCQEAVFVDVLTGEEIDESYIDINSLLSFTEIFEVPSVNNIKWIKKIYLRDRNVLFDPNLIYLGDVYASYTLREVKSGFCITKRNKRKSNVLLYDLKSSGLYSYENLRTLELYPIPLFSFSDDDSCLYVDNLRKAAVDENWGKEVPKKKILEYNYTKNH